MDASVVAEIPDLPENLFVTRYEGKISFGDQAFWRLRTSVPQRIDQHNFPTFWIEIHEDEDFSATEIASYQYFLFQGKVITRLTGYGLPGVEGLEQEFLVDAYESPVRETIRHLIEAQLLMLK